MQWLTHVVSPSNALLKQIAAQAGNGTPVDVPRNAPPPQTSSAQEPVPETVLTPQEKHELELLEQSEQYLEKYTNPEDEHAKEYLRNIPPESVAEYYNAMAYDDFGKSYDELDYRELEMAKKNYPKLAFMNNHFEQRFGKIDGDKNPQAYEYFWNKYWENPKDIQGWNDKTYE